MEVFTLALVSSIVGLVAPQSLVLVGGGLTDGNAVIWNKVIELAVKTIHAHLL